MSIFSLKSNKIFLHNVLLFIKIYVDLRLEIPLFGREDV